MKKLFAAVCLMMCIFSCNRHAEPLRVMSYNIRLGVAKDSSNRWDIRKPATPAMLDAIRPAVFGVQEAYDFQVDYILKNCPRFKAVGVGREDGVHEGEHMSVFYDTTRINLLDWGNYWLSEHPESPGCRLPSDRYLDSAQRPGKRQGILLRQYPSGPCRQSGAKRRLSLDLQQDTGDEPKRTPHDPDRRLQRPA